jgi:hypothetical protein
LLAVSWPLGGRLGAAWRVLRVLRVLACVGR